MLKYPIRLGFSARSEMKWPGYNDAASALEKHINEALAAEPDDVVRSFFYPQLACELRLDPNLVEQVLFAADCGSHGITIRKGDLDRALERRRD